MQADVVDWGIWASGARRASGLGVCCWEGQADGVPCSCASGECERCRRAFEEYALAVGAELPAPAAGAQPHPA